MFPLKILKNTYNLIPALFLSIGTISFIKNNSLKDKDQKSSYDNLMAFTYLPWIKFYEINVLVLASHKASRLLILH